MKVMCIKNGEWLLQGIKGNRKTPYGPKFGEEVNATQCPIYESGYDLKEYPTDEFGKKTSWYKKYFIPLSDIDETELVKERLVETNQ